MGYVLADQIARTPMPDLTGPEKHVLVTMAFYAHGDGKNVFCGAKVLAANTSLGQRTVERAIAALRRKGYLVESHFRNRKRVFDIRLDGGCPDTDIPDREDSADSADDDNRRSGEVHPPLWRSTSASLTYEAVLNRSMNRSMNR
jgi:hypothetical protein